MAGVALRTRRLLRGRVDGCWQCNELHNIRRHKRHEDVNRNQCGGTSDVVATLGTVGGDGGRGGPGSRARGGTE